MYIYLDKQGIVKEIINDEALRQSASNVNEIYVYYDGLQESDIGSVLATYGLPDGIILDAMEVATQTEKPKEIPYDAERDLKYFQYYKPYPFYHFAIDDVALSQKGVVRLMLSLVQKNGEYIKVAGLICFDVEGELVKDDHGVSLAQYNYLVKAWMDTKECLPLDGSKAMRADLDMGSHSVLLNGKALKDKNGALNYNGKDLAKQEDLSSTQNDVASLKQDNTKNKADIASLKSDNTANKADISALKADNTKNKSDIVGLQMQVDTINATQNVVDIVGTKAELNAYSTKDLHANDKIEVLVDESQNDANTIYEWDGKKWTLVGSKAPYYSKAESDARYNELKAKSYDKDTTGYVTGHVPDSALVKGSLDSISESVETLSMEVVKKNTDASLKSVTIPTASDLKTKDGSKIGALPSPWVATDELLGAQSDSTGTSGGLKTLFGIVALGNEQSDNQITSMIISPINNQLPLVSYSKGENIESAIVVPDNFYTESMVIDLGDINTNKNDIATLKTKSYDKDATLDDLTQGHVPDSNVVKGISVDVKAHKQMIDTLGDEVIKSVKKDTDASLKSLTLPSASALKAKDGSSFGGAKIFTILFSRFTQKSETDTYYSATLTDAEKNEYIASDIIVIDMDGTFIKFLNFLNGIALSWAINPSTKEFEAAYEIVQNDNTLDIHLIDKMYSELKFTTIEVDGSSYTMGDDIELTSTQYEQVYSEGKYGNIKIKFANEGPEFDFFFNGVYPGLGGENNAPLVTYSPVFLLQGYLMSMKVKNGKHVLTFDSPFSILGFDYENNKLKYGPSFTGAQSIFTNTINGEAILSTTTSKDIKVQPKLYHHIITLHNTATPSYFAFETDIMWQAEITKETLFNVMNGRIVVGTGVVQNVLINKISFHNTDEKTKVHQYASFGASGYVNAEVVFKDVFGTDYTLEDVTYPLS